MPSFRTLVVNGRFLTAKPTGVQRVAQQLLTQLHRQAEVLVPLFLDGVVIRAPASVAAGTDASGLPVEPVGRLGGHGWEQVELPGHARGALLLNLCNMAPMGKRDAITMIHDAQVYTMPSSYSRAFRAWYRFVLPVVGRRHCRILTVSHYSARQLVEFGVAPADRITVIHNGVDHVLDFAADRSVNDAHGLAPRSYVLALSSTQHHKNIQVLLRAFDDGRLAPTRLVLIGATGATECAAAGLDVPAGTMFAGKVSDGQMRALMEDALCFAMPSLTEGFGLPPLEAMLLGCPAILSPCGALPEVGGDAVLYADPHDSAAWAEHIRSLRDEPDLRARQIEAGRAQAGQFTWEAAGRKLVETIARVAAARAG